MQCTSTGQVTGPSSGADWCEETSRAAHSRGRDDLWMMDFGHSQSLLILRWHLLTNLPPAQLDPLSELELCGEQTPVWMELSS